MRNSALVVVDMLYDFIDGTLACQNAENAVKETLKQIDKLTKGQGGGEHEILDTFPILFVRDQHPADHCSFTEQGGTWPAHCVAGTHGGEVHEDLKPYVREELTFILADTLVGHYEGFLGVDQIICQAGSPAMVPVSEINLRMTMGLIARNRHDKLKSQIIV